MLGTSLFLSLIFVATSLALISHHHLGFLVFRGFGFNKFILLPTMFCLCRYKCSFCFFVLNVIFPVYFLLSCFEVLITSSKLKVELLKVSLRSLQSFLFSFPICKDDGA